MAGCRFFNRPNGNGAAMLYGDDAASGLVSVVGGGGVQATEPGLSS